jgi:O-antigen ligase
MAAISISKLAILLFALWVLLSQTRTASITQARASCRDAHVIAVLLMIAALAVSITYSSAPLTDAAMDVGKYAKLLLIILIPLLISTHDQARTALTFYVVSQSFVLLSSWLLVGDVYLPWVSSTVHATHNTVFHLYIHQSIMTTGLAAICWHLSNDIKSTRVKIAARALCLGALVNVLFALEGRTGYFAAVSVIAAALFWEMRQRWRWLASLIPVLIVCLAMLASPHFESRVHLVVTEFMDHKAGEAPSDSTSFRLNFWHRSLQAIEEQPLTGFGAGSWVQQYHRLDGGADQRMGGNPHQEYLLWGVLLGIGGIGLLIGLMGALWWDARKFPASPARALKSLILILAITSLFNSVLYDGVIGDYFCLMLGLLLGYGKTHPRADAVIPCGPALAGLQTP